MSPGTPGCFLNAYEETENGRIYYKLSNYDSYRGVFGHECINELIVSRVMNVLKIPHLQYRLIHAELLETDREYILNGLDEILSRNHLTKIWQMIWKRWCRYEEICGKGRTLWE